MTRITRLQLTDFRNHAALTLACDAPLVVLTGENGAGKTNILEALSLLAPGRGLRGAALADMARQGGAGGFAAAARLGDVALGTGTDAATPERRLVRINGAAQPASALAEWLAIVWLTPAYDRLFTGPAGDRRRFLDRLVLALEPAHGIRATRYEAAMRQRNRLLEDLPAADPAWLDALEAAMLDHGAAVAAARDRLILALTEELAGQDSGPFARPALALDRVPVIDLKAARPRDAAAGRTLSGPHRDDLAVRHAGKDQPAALCSTGEQKALLIALVLAHAARVSQARGAPPLLLLDEVAAHLDPLRRGALLDRVAALGGQAWVTGTEPALFDAAPPNALRLRVVEGRVEASA